MVTSTESDPSPEGVMVAPALMPVQPFGNAGVMIGAVSPLTVTSAVTVRSDTPCKVLQVPLIQVWDDTTVPGIVTLTGAVTLIRDCAEAAPGARATLPASAAVTRPARIMIPARISCLRLSRGIMA